MKSPSTFSPLCFLFSMMFAEAAHGSLRPSGRNSLASSAAPFPQPSASMPGKPLGNHTVQYSTAQHSTVQYITVQYSTVQYSTVQYSTVHGIVCMIKSLQQSGTNLLASSDAPCPQPSASMPGIPVDRLAVQYSEVVYSTVCTVVCTVCTLQLSTVQVRWMVHLFIVLGTSVHHNVTALHFCQRRKHVFATLPVSCTVSSGRFAASIRESDAEPVCAHLQRQRRGGPLMVSSALLIQFSCFFVVCCLMVYEYMLSHGIKLWCMM